MEQEEMTELVDCMDCGATIAPSIDRAFALSDETFLCFACAMRRGGEYDATEDRWTKMPNVSDEPDERRAHP